MRYLFLTSTRIHRSVIGFFAFLLLSSAGYAQNELTITLAQKNDDVPINRHIFGQFAEHLGRGIYEGIWVGPDSDIPNTRGIRKDVVEALKQLKVPNVRWPGGCFADEYHWRDGVGPMSERKKRINASWGRGEPNTFGTHEYFDFLEQIGAEAFISANVGSGTVQEAADWLEYLTGAGSSLAEQRARNGHPKPFEVAFWGIGNETWGCGGPFSAEEYLPLLKRFSNFSTNYHPDAAMQQVAVGPDSEDYADYTPVIMKAWSEKSWAWDIQALSLHRYTRNGWPPNILATGFNEAQYASVLAETLGMDKFIAENRAIMDRYDAEEKIAIMVDEWGGWYAPTPGSPADFLEQQNSQRDAILAALNFNIFIRHAERVRGANIAQMVNVLQAMILTDHKKMVLTPTYHAFRLYVPFQDAMRVPLNMKRGTYRTDKTKLPRFDAVAAERPDGTLVVALTHLGTQESVSVELGFDQAMSIAQASAETLQAPAMDAVNTFSDPNRVVPRALPVSVKKNRVSFQAAPHSLTVVQLSPEK